MKMFFRQPQSSPHAFPAGFRASSRLAMRVPLLAGACLVAGCDLIPEDNTRPGDVVLPAETLASARASETAAPVALAPGGEECRQLTAQISQLAGLGNNVFRFDGEGGLEANEDIWTRLPEAQRQNLLRALAVQNRCATQADRGTGIVRSLDSRAAVLGRYREP